jgi:hypothetical protein
LGRGYVPNMYVDESGLGTWYRSVGLTFVVKSARVR